MGGKENGHLQNEGIFFFPPMKKEDIYNNMNNLLFYVFVFLTFVSD